jgi:alpha-N-acetylglucosamine transferase
LEEGWEGWWGKVTLFNAEIEGKKFYIDLDMVITGNLDKLFEYDGQFAILRSGDFACQKNHKEGYNSSIMIWKGDFLKPVYKALKGNF